MPRSCLLALACALLLLAGNALAAATVSASGDTPLYETFELTFNAPGISGNKFTQFASVTFSKDSRSFAVDGFHDGNDKWIARFMPDEEGTWNYSWSFNGGSGSGSFNVTARANAKNHGHVHVDAAHPRYLVYDDGSPHYFVGGKWIDPRNYGPTSKGGEQNNDPSHEGRFSDEQFLSYLDELEKTNHNGLLLKTGLYPIENDTLSWDLGWIRRGEWLVREGGKRGIYFHLNFFDTWSRDRNRWFRWNTSGGSQPFNVWSGGDEAAKENYIRTLVARFAGYANVYWELGNEMEHAPNDGSAFASQANSKYIPWIRKYDPYDLPIGLSEGVWTETDVDIGFLHQPDTLPPLNPSRGRPTLMNELVSGCSIGSMWVNETMRNPAARYCYRRTFWRNFTYGGSGSSETTWLNLQVLLNDAVKNVHADHGVFKRFIDGLPLNVNEMDAVDKWVSSGPAADYSRTRRKEGAAYVTYFAGNGAASAGTATLSSLPPGTYNVKWFNPVTGQQTGLTTQVNGGSNIQVQHPAFTDDLVLYVVNVTLEDSMPPSAPANLAATASGQKVNLSWTAATDDKSGVKAYRVYRKKSGGGYALLADIAAVTLYTDASAGPNSQYFYRVSAVDGAGLEGAQSNEASATTGDDPPATPAGLEAVGSNQLVQLSWQANQEADWAGYDVYRGPSASGPFAKANAATLSVAAYADTAVTNNTTYYYAVEAVDAAGNRSPRSDLVTATPTPELAVSSLSPSNYVAVKNGFVNGATQYIDRSQTISSIPDLVKGATYIQTANNDKYSSGSTFLSFEVNQAVQVYVGHDTRFQQKPQWLSSWERTGETFQGAGTFELFAKSFPAGPVILGGNTVAGEGDNSMYTVVIVPATGSTPPPTPCTPQEESGAAGNCSDGKDNDCDGLIDAADSSCPAAPPAGAPYPASPVVKTLTLDWSTHRRLAPGSDNWPITWADDGHQYTSWGDGGGFGGDNSDGRVSLGIARVEGGKDDYQGFNVWGGKNGANPATFDGKSYGILSVDGTLYMWRGPGSDATSYNEARLYQSTNHGASWSPAAWAFTKSDGIVMPTLLNFGKDYAGARDNYVYSYAIELKNASGLVIQKPGELALMRVPKDRIQDRSAWEFFAGLNGSTPNWTSNLAARKPVFVDAKGVGWNVSASYNAGLKRYFLITEHDASMSGKIGVFDAPEPWGPWTTVWYADSFGSGAIEPTTFYWNFANKWASADGKDVVLVFTGTNSNDSWNTVEGHFETLQSPTVCVADFNNDGRRDILDLVLMVGYLLTGNLLGDLTLDLLVNILDIVYFAVYLFGIACP